ncbi:hypothetical protein BDV95DRAFT_65220 [Massariosphaeria phaeospora]|uniref:Uncharacterized protein n=1 Tax=Massariosphaeria phaeospora TaxID=100035 RepID=A0A7C8MMM2_9PLEO|nr:hypothetical protein BDV95DRAFT_65220 [Massariosphaeria phaeospora]
MVFGHCNPLDALCLALANSQLMQISALTSLKAPTVRESKQPLLWRLIPLQSASSTDSRSSDLTANRFEHVALQGLRSPREDPQPADFTRESSFFLVSLDYLTFFVSPPASPQRTQPHDLSPRPARRCALSRTHLPPLPPDLPSRKSHGPKQANGEVAQVFQARRQGRKEATGLGTLCRVHEMAADAEELLEGENGECGRANPAFEDFDDKDHRVQTCLLE